MTEADWLACDDPQRMLAHLDGRTTVRGFLGVNVSRPPPSDRKLRLFACACCRQVWHLLTDGAARKAILEAARKAEGQIDRLEVPWLDWRDGTQNVPEWLREWSPCASNPTEAARRCCNNRDLSASQAALLRDIVGNPWRPVGMLRPGDKLKMLSEPTHRLVPAHEGDPVAATVMTINGDLMRVLPSYSDLLTPATAVVWTAWRPTWLTPTVQALARAAYEERRVDGSLDPDLLLVLSDALEEAGCDNEDILRHLRGLERCPLCLAAGQWAKQLVGTGGERIGTTWAETVPCPRCDGHGWRPLRGPHVRGCWALDLLLGKE